MQKKGFREGNLSKEGICNRRISIISSQARPLDRGLGVWSVATPRYVGMDLARAFAIICVVLCHADEAIFSLSLWGYQNMSVFQKAFSFLAFTVGRLGVPIFLMLSGYFLLSKHIESDEDCWHFYKHNFIPLLLKIEAWIMIYNLFLPLFNGTEFNVEGFFKNVFFLENVPMCHSWYLAMIVGIYLAIPFVALVVKRFSRAVIFIPLTIVLLRCFVLPFFNLYFGIYGIWKQYNFVLDLSFLGGGYGVYLIFGYLVRQNTFKKIPTLAVVLSALLFFVFCVYTQIFCYRRGVAYNIWYDSLPLLICTLSLFELFHRIKRLPRPVASVAKALSETSFAIYLIHVLLQMIFLRDFPHPELPPHARVIIVWTTVLSFGFFVTYAVKSQYAAMKQSLTTEYEYVRLRRSAFYKSSPRKIGD